jgi:ClpP class serine protease
MPNFNQIVEDIACRSRSATCDIIRHEYLEKLHDLTHRNVVLYYSAWQQKTGREFQTGIDDLDMNGFMSVLHGLDWTKGLDLILHTPGGNLAATEAIGEYLKTQFDNNIRVIVPHLAMSGGTLLAFASSTIIMGNHSSLGPIDPIINGMPAHGICEEFDYATRAVEQNPSTIEVWKYIISKYHPSLLGECKKAITWSNEIATKWLSSGMFAKSAKDEDELREFIRKIVDNFGDHGITKSHSRHFMASQCKDIGLNITPLEENSQLQDVVLSAHHATIYTLSETPIVKMIENHQGNMYAIRQQMV